MASPGRTVAGLIAVYEASREAFKGRLALNLPALNVKVGEMLTRSSRWPARRCARVRFERDERIAGIVANWPTGASGARRGAGPAGGQLVRGHHPPVHRRLRSIAQRRRSTEGLAR